MLAASVSNAWIWIIYGVGLVIIFYIFSMPQKKEQKRREAMIKDMAIGDSVVTTSGFYGTLIAIEGDDVIVEFGNKNCRIPMKKDAIYEVEKA